MFRGFRSQSPQPRDGLVEGNMVVFLIGFGAWALGAAVCLALITLICRGGQLEDELVAEHAGAFRTDEIAAHHPLPAAMSSDFAPRSALDDVMRAAQQTGLVSRR
jgi:hypothetical protein